MSDRLGKKPVNWQAGSLSGRDRKSFDRSDKTTTNQNPGRACAKAWWAEDEKEAGMG